MVPGTAGRPGVGLTVMGTLGEVNEALSTATYRTAPNWYGLDALTVTVEDRAAGGGGEGDGGPCGLRCALPSCPTGE